MMNLSGPAYEWTTGRHTAIISLFIQKDDKIRTFITILVTPWVTFGMRNFGKGKRQSTVLGVSCFLAAGFRQKKNLLGGFA